VVEVGPQCWRIGQDGPGLGQPALRCQDRRPGISGDRAHPLMYPADQLLDLPDAVLADPDREQRQRVQAGRVQRSVAQQLRGRLGVAALGVSEAALDVGEHALGAQVHRLRLGHPVPPGELQLAVQ
jgi:hypothetical protein